MQFSGALQGREMNKFAYSPTRRGVTCGSRDQARVAQVFVRRRLTTWFDGFGKTPGWQRHKRKSGDEETCCLVGVRLTAVTVERSAGHANILPPGNGRHNPPVAA